jgi:shikimate dehydrogenase
MDRYALFGHPASHSWSPFIHGLFAREQGRPLDYQLVDVVPDRFRSVALEFFASGGCGANITVPHKLAAAELTNGLTPRAQRAGAVNTLAIRGGSVLLGDNTDGAGLVADMSANLGIRLEGRRLLMLGAGGAVRGVLAPLLEQRPDVVMIANRTVARAEELARAFGDLGKLESGSFDDAGESAWDVVINATSAGLSGAIPPLPDSIIRPDSVCYDMSYSRAATPFQCWATERGVQRAYQGWGMLVEQAAEAYLLWRGVRPDTAPVRGALATLSG